MAYLLRYLQPRIRAVARTPSDGDRDAVRTGLGELALLHHGGLATALLMTTLELALIVFG